MRAAAWTIVVLGAVACTARDPDPVAGGDTAAVQSGAGADTGRIAGGGGGPVADTALSGVRWMLAAVGGTSARPAEPQRSAYLELVPAEGRASGNTTCNRFSGPYTLEGSSLSFGPLISTRMACVDSLLNAQEAAFLGALQETAGWRMEGDTLVLTGTSGDLARLTAGE